jgi:hypothetical protein
MMTSRPEGVHRGIQRRRHILQHRLGRGEAGRLQQPRMAGALQPTS